ncbi:MAG: hypothetical protein VZR11_03670 [Succinimonas sp.]|nr:hypothetical protein [Succinimonas sp.]
MSGLQTPDYPYSGPDSDVMKNDIVPLRSNRAVIIYERCAALMIPRRPQPPPAVPVVFIRPYIIAAGILRRLTVSFAFIKEILFRLRNAETENPIPGIISYISQLKTGYFHL